MLHRCQSLIVVALPPGRQEEKQKTGLRDYPRPAKSASLRYHHNWRSTHRSQPVLNVALQRRCTHHGLARPPTADAPWQPLFRSHATSSASVSITKFGTLLILGNSSAVLCVSDGTCMVHFSCCNSPSGSAGWAVRVCMSSEMNSKFPSERSEKDIFNRNSFVAASPS